MDDMHAHIKEYSKFAYLEGLFVSWVKKFRINPEFRILRLTFHTFNLLIWKVCLSHG